MPIGNWNLQWLNHNSQRAYPLTERASKTDTARAITIPDSFIVELYLPIHSGTSFSPEKFFIKSLLISPTGFNIVVGYSENGANSVDVAAANIARSSFAANRAYALTGVDDYYDSVGYVVLGNLDEVDVLAPGLYTFDPLAGELEAGVIRPMLRGISRLVVVNGSNESQDIYGDVVLVAGNNVRLDVAVSGATTNIIFNAISGENLNQDCLCEIPDTGDCITQINGQTSIDGNFEIGANECIEIEGMNGGIRISDICAQPCCGCTELNAVISQLDRFGDGITTLQNFVTRLGSEVTQMSLVVLGSRLSSTGCNAETG
jgi:hypothetical protein